MLRQKRNKSIKKDTCLIEIIIILLAFIIFTKGIPICGYSQSINTIIIEFKREYREEDNKETTEGKIYYQTPSKLVIKVHYPINQWMILEKNETTIYYPNESQAFHIIYKNPSTMPFFQNFIVVINEDYGLPDLGYTITSYERKENILISYWSPPKNLSKILGRFILKYMDNKLIYAESENAKGEVIIKIFYKNHIIYGGNYFPLEISITKFQNTGSTFEKVEFINPQFNSPIPQEIIDFKIPANVKIKEIRW